MARKATSKTSNTDLVADILADQWAFAVAHLSSGNPRRTRITHNLKELFRRLGDVYDVTDPLYCE